MKLVKESEGRVFSPPLHSGVTSREIVSKDTPAQHVAFHLSTIAPGSGSDLDSHPVSEQIFYVMSGQVTFRTEGAGLVARAGETVFIAAGEPHATLNVGEVDAVCLVITAPPA